MDSAYSDAGAEVVAVGDGQAWSQADLLLCVQTPEPSNLAKLRRGAVVVGLLSPYSNEALAASLQSGGLSAMALELLPRISRAQSADALSSQANIAGYKAVLLGSAALDRYFPMLMTAAGTVQPAKVVILGAGVAGLQAVATARRLGAVVFVSDIRPAVKEQVESLELVSSSPLKQTTSPLNPVATPSRLPRLSSLPNASSFLISWRKPMWRSAPRKCLVAVHRA